MIRGIWKYITLTLKGTDEEEKLAPLVVRDVDEEDAPSSLSRPAGKAAPPTIAPVVRRIPAAPTAENSIQRINRRLAAPAFSSPAGVSV